MSASYNLASDNKSLFLRKVMRSSLTDQHRAMADALRRRFNDHNGSTFCSLSTEQRQNLQEADTIRYYITPVLETLRFKYREKLINEDRKFPDIWLFSEEPDEPSDTYYQHHNIGILEAKARHIHLDIGSSSDKRPVEQLAGYLKTNQNANPFRNWGILCNGAEWRIYNAESPDRYFSFDLEHALEQPEELELFCLMVSPEAFAISTNQKCLLDEWRAASLQSWKIITDELKIRCPKILQSLIQDGCQSKQSLKDSMKQSFSALFRFLFILHVESRGFFGRASTAYAESSLRHLLDRMAFQTFKEGDMAAEVQRIFLLYRNGSSVVPAEFGGEFFSNITLVPWKNRTLRKVLRELCVFSVHDGETYFFDYGSLSVELIGDVYEAIIGMEPKLEGKEVYFSKTTNRTQSLANQTGATYTPSHVVQYLVSSALDGLSVTQPTICDPACGSGHFLIAALRQLAQRTSLQETEVATYEDHKKYLAKKCIFGVDINATAAQLTRLMLAIETLDIRSPVVDLRANIICQDSLQVSWKSSRDWFSQFSASHSLIQHGFDLVVGNPPYIRARADSVLNNRKKILESGQYTHLKGNWDLWLPFVQLCVGLANPNHGRIALVVAESISYAPFAQDYNSFLCNQNLVQWVSHFDEKFEGWSLKGCCFLLDASRPGGSFRRSHHKAATDIFTESAASIPFVREDTGNLAFANQSYRGLYLKDVAYVSKGVALHSHKRHLPFIKFKKDDLLQDTEDRMHPFSWIDASNISLGTRDISNQKWVEFGAEPMRAPRYADGGTFPELHMGPRVLLGSSSNSVKVHFLSETGVASQNLIIIKRWDDFEDISVVPGKKRKANDISSEGISQEEALRFFSAFVSYDLLQAIFISSYFKRYIAATRRDKYRLVPDVVSNLPIPIGLRASAKIFKDEEFGPSFSRRLKRLRTTEGPGQHVEIIFLLEKAVDKLREKNFSGPHAIYRAIDDLVDLLYAHSNNDYSSNFLDKQEMINFLKAEKMNLSMSKNIKKPIHS